MTGGSTRRACARWKSVAEDEPITGRWPVQWGLVSTGPRNHSEAHRGYQGTV